MAQLMAAGELALCVNYAGTIDRLKADGAPVAWKPPVAPLILEPEGTAPAADPSHPAAALLLLDWSLGHNGQKAVVANGSGSVRPELAAVPAAQTKLVDTAALAKVEKQWTDRWEQLLRRGKVAPSSG
jgi:ABC-type Fe3+ transport system substrate-binding protein